ncbi:hypothetical protein Tco_1578164 [Tanacetum coccineum]
MNKKNYSFDLETFRDMLQICPNLPGQKFKDPPFEEDILAFIRELGYPGDIKSLSDVKKKVDYVYLLWEDLVYQIENKVSKKNKDMYYPRFTKVIINHFMSKDQSIPRRNKVDWHMANDDPILTTMRFIPKHETVQREKTNQASIASLGKRLKATAKVAKSGKKKLHAQGLETLSKFALSEISWKSSDEEDDDEVSLSKDDDDNADHEDDESQDNDNVQTELDNYGDDFVHPKFSTHDEEERQDKEDKEEEGDNVEGEELDEEETNEKEEVNQLYRDVNVNLEGRDTEMTDALLANVQTTQVIEDTHVIITAVTPEAQQQSSYVSSGFISNLLNPNPDTGIDSILNMNTELTSLVDVPVSTNVEMPSSSVTTLPPPPIPLVQPQQQTPVPTPAIVPSTSLQNLPTFGSLFKFEDRVKSLEDDFSEFKQTNLFAEAVSSIPGIVDKYLANQMNEAVKIAVQLQSNRLRSEAQVDNEDFINKIDENMKKIIKEQVKIQVKEQVTKILPKFEKSINEQLEAEVLIRSSSEAKTSHAVAANLSDLKVDAYESDKDILATYGDTVTLKGRRDDEDEDEEPSTVSNRGSKRRRARKEPELTSVPKEKTSKSSGKTKEGSKYHQKSTGKSAQAEEPIHADEDFTLARNEDPRESFNELMDTPLDFSAFVLNRLKVDTLTPELLAGPTFKLMKGSCKSLVELEYFLEEVCKATTDQLDWNNPEGQQYTHDLRKPLPLIPNSRGYRVIPFDHFINNDLAYLSGGVSSQTYATLVMKTKAEDYGNIKWIEDFIPNSMWSRESTRDVYSKHRILAVTKIKIVEWHHYKYLDWITVHKNDDKLYTFKEGDYNRLRL